VLGAVVVALESLPDLVVEEMVDFQRLVIVGVAVDSKKAVNEEILIIMMKEDLEMLALGIQVLVKRVRAVLVGPIMMKEAEEAFLIPLLAIQVLGVVVVALESLPILELVALETLVIVVIMKEEVVVDFLILDLETLVLEILVLEKIQMIGNKIMALEVVEEEVEEEVVVEEVVAVVEVIEEEVEEAEGFVTFSLAPEIANMEILANLNMNKAKVVETRQIIVDLVEEAVAAVMIVVVVVVVVVEEEGEVFNVTAVQVNKVMEEVVGLAVVAIVVAGSKIKAGSKAEEMEEPVSVQEDLRRVDFQIAGLEEVRVVDLEILVVEIVTERDVENQMRVLVGEDLEMKVLGMAVF
uniref:Uncharacterized protein n=1 Tax=Meloidogyne incognita TaxID=6306 RepID=A0A914M1X8_MELIC